MNNSYSKSLYDLYKDGRMCCDKFEEAVDFLIKDESGIDQFAEGLAGGLPNYRKINIRTFKDTSLKKAYDFIKDYHENWHNEVSLILDKLSQVRFRMRFDKPMDKSSTSNAVGHINYDFSEDMKKFLDVYDKFCDEVDELYSIINDYEETILKMPELRKLEPTPENVVYRLRYNAIQGKLYLDDIEVCKCNLGSKLDKALSDAFKTPEKAVKTAGSVASALDAIRMPKALKSLVFRASKGSFVAKAEITADDLEKAKLNKETLDCEIQKLSK